MSLGLGSPIEGGYNGGYAPAGADASSEGGGGRGPAGSRMLTITTELPRSSAWCSCRVRCSCFHAERLFSTLPLFFAPGLWLGVRMHDARRQPLEPR